MSLEFWVEQTARGTYRDRLWEVSEAVDFSSGDIVVFDPFRDSGPSAVLCVFDEYADEDERVAEVTVPPEAEHDHQWFNEVAGSYHVHERYLTPFERTGKSFNCEGLIC
jgi:hypothetical protein